MTQMPVYPSKRLNYGVMFGSVACGPNGWDTHEVPTNGTGTTPRWSCSGSQSNANSGTSNLMQWLKANNWSLLLGMWEYELYNPNVTSPGTSKTIMEDFADTYVNLMDDNNMKWQLNLELVFNDTSTWTYQSNAAAYEAAVGTALDYIEDNCNTNFEGYAFEDAYYNGVKWLGDRTNYSISCKTYCGFNEFYKMAGVNNKMGTNPDGSDIVPMPTAMQYSGLLDEVVVEIYLDTFYNTNMSYLSTLKATYPNMPVILNIDHVCSHETWSGTPLSGSPTESGSDEGWWAASGVGEPSNRCAAEQAACLSHSTSLKALTGPIDGMIYNFYRSAYPSASGVPDIQWFLQWAETNIAPLLKTSSPTPRFAKSTNVTLQIP